MLPIRRLLLVLVLASAFAPLFAAPAGAAERACVVAAPAEVVACEQQRAQAALEALTDRYARVWAALPAERRLAFSAAERHWLNGGRWDAHAACVAASNGAAPVEVIAARCLADVTTTHLGTLATPM